MSKEKEIDLKNSSPNSYIAKFIEKTRENSLELSY